LNGKQPDTSNLVENTALFDATAKHLGTTREILIAGLLDEVAIPMLMTMSVDDRLAVLNASGTHAGYKQHLIDGLKRDNQ
jgi:hypothetical protein